MDHTIQRRDDPLPPPGGGVDASPIMRSVAVVIRRRKFLIYCGVAGIAIGIVVTMLSPRQFTTSFSFMPQVPSDAGRSGLASLAGQFGVSLGSLSGQGASPQLYADLLGTRAILEPIVMDSVRDASNRYVTVGELLGNSGARSARGVERTVQRLRDNIITTNVATRTTGVVSVGVKTKSAAGSLAIAQELLAGLNKFNLVTRQSQAAAERRFVEGRLAAAKGTLTDAENRLRQFQEANRVIANSPALSFQQDRLRRDVTTQQDLVASLTQQFEDARIREVRDTPVITIIDQPTLAATPDPRGGGRIIVGSATVALVIAFCIIFGADKWQRELTEHGLASWRSLSNDELVTRSESA